MRGLFAKLSAVLLVLLLFVGGVTLALTLRMSQLHLQEVQQRLNRRLATDILADTRASHGEEIRDDTLKEIFHRLMVINPSIEVYLLDPRGEIEAFSAAPGEVRRQRVSVAPIRAFLEEAAPLPIEGDDPRSERGTKIFSAAPIGRNGEREGYLYVVLASEDYTSLAQMLRASYVLRAGAVMVAGAFLLALVGGVVVFRRLTRRLGSLAAEMVAFEGREIARDDEPTREAREAQRGDEVDRLAGAFRLMAMRIRAQIAQLHNADRQRRDLVASVSHDLRTPLTHLQGYLETLLLKENATPAQRRECLDIALQQSEQLGQRLDRLFELAKLDALRAPLDLERFSVAELVQDVVQKFQPAAGEAGISLRAQMDETLVTLTADPALIERALENLIQNAIHFTPSGGSVVVAVMHEEGNVRIEVRDTGVGIAASDLPHIFDPFYRAAPSRRADGGSGLGLAIAKRAPDVHGTEFRCTSVVGQGTSFTFDLSTTT
jgi:signal transduction histidine kinase